MLAAALAGYPLVYAGDLIAPAALLAGLGLLLVLLSILPRAPFVLAPGLLALAGGYVLVEATNRAAALSVVGYAAGLVVLAELLLWLGQLPSPGRMESAVLARWLQGVALIAMAAVVLAALVLVAGELQLAGAVSGAMAGSLALLLLLGLPWFLLRTRSRRAHAPDREG